MNFGKIKNKIISFFKEKENFTIEPMIKEKSLSERKLILTKLVTNNDFTKNLYYLQDSMGYIYSNEGLMFTYFHVRVNNILKCTINKHFNNYSETCRFDIDLTNKELVIIDDKNLIFNKFIDILVA